jgi:hypothetical protein
MSGANGLFQVVAHDGYAGMLEMRGAAGGPALAPGPRGGVLGVPGRFARVSHVRVLRHAGGDELS